MVKKISKILIVMLILLSISFMYNKVFAEIAWGTIESGIDSVDGGNAATSANSIVSSIIGAARIIALGIAIIMIAVLAMKYMMAAPGERADIKKGAVLYIVGAVVLFASSGILGIIANFADKIG